MRLWHYKLIPYLPKDMLVSQWRECIAIKRQWEKGTLKHRLVSYVMKYDKSYLTNYTRLVMNEMNRRDIKTNNKLWFEMCDFSNCKIVDSNYEEHNNRYLTQCYYNLQEKYDRGIISDEEYSKIQDCIIKELDGVV